MTYFKLRVGKVKHGQTTWEGGVYCNYPLNNLRFIQEEDRLHNFNLEKFKNPNNNPNLERIIKGNVMNTPFYSTSSQINPRNPNSPTENYSVV